MKRRALTIALAVLLAVLGTGGVLAYVNHANARALAGQQAVTVLIARQVIPAGTSAADAQAQGLLGTERLPSASVPADALTAITPAISALVTDADVQPGQLLLRPMLVTSVPSTSGLAIPRGMVAVAIQFCVPEAVAGNLHARFAGRGLRDHRRRQCEHHRAGGVQRIAHLRWLAERQHQAGAPQGDGTRGGTGHWRPGRLDVEFEFEFGSGQNTGLITVAVSQADASQLIALSENGLPYLALLADR